MSEVLVAEKAGMLVGGNKEDGYNVVGWVLAGDEYDCDTDSGEALVTHHKTAEKLGLGDVFKEMKAENAPSKAKKEVSGEKKERAPRKAVPKEGTYTVLKAETLTAGENCERKEIAKLLASNTDFATFWAVAPAKFNHAGRDEVMKEFATSGFVAYAINRGMISVDA